MAVRAYLLLYDVICHFDAVNKIIDYIVKYYRFSKSYYKHERMPKVLTFVSIDKTKPNSSLEALARGEVDVITTIDAATPESVLQFHKKHADEFTLHRTQDIRNILISYSERGQQLFSSEQRRCLGRKIREAFTAQTAESLAYKTGVQFLPVFGEGGLSKEQLSQLAQSFQEATDCPKSGAGDTAVIIVSSRLKTTVFDLQRAN